MSEKRPFVINLFAGAGAGKTTAAWGLCYNLKSMVIKAEERNATKPETAKKKSLDDIVKSATERAKDANDNLISKSAQKDHTTEI